MEEPTGAKKRVGLAKKTERRELVSGEAIRFLELWDQVARTMAEAGFRRPAAFLSDCLLDIPEVDAEARGVAKAFEKRNKGVENVGWFVHVGRDGRPYVEVEGWV